MVLAVRWVFCISEQKATFDLYIITWMAFITMVESVYSVVRTDSIHRADYVSSLKVKPQQATCCATTMSRAVDLTTGPWHSLPSQYLTQLPTSSDITCCCQSCSAWRFKISNTKLRTGLFVDLLLQSSLFKFLCTWRTQSYLQPKLLVNANSSSFKICYCYFCHVSTCGISLMSFILAAQTMDSSNPGCHWYHIVH